jgi:hypothetical protein
VAIFSDFDQLVQEELQKMMEASADKMDRSDQEIGAINEDTLEEKAKTLATERFHKCYRDVLLDMQHPPQAVVEVSGSKCGLQRAAGKH